MYPSMSPSMYPSMSPSMSPSKAQEILGNPREILVESPSLARSARSPRASRRRAGPQPRLTRL